MDSIDINVLELHDYWVRIWNVPICWFFIDINNSCLQIVGNKYFLIL